MAAPAIPSSNPNHIPTATVSTTRILHLSGFSPELKTRDIQSVFADWEEEGGGFKIKWVDDTTCLIVFQDAGVAKRAFLNVLSNPPPLLSLPSPTSPTGAKLRAHTGPDVTHILTSVQNRPRSRSNAATGVGLSTHSRKSSVNVGSMGSGGGVNGISAGSMGRRDSLGNGHSRQGSLRSASMNTGSGSHNRVPSAAQIQSVIENATSGSSGTSSSPPKQYGLKTPPQGSYSEFGTSGNGDSSTTRSASSSPDQSFVSAASSSSPAAGFGGGGGMPQARVSDAGKRFVNAALGVRGNKSSGSTGSELESVAKGVQGMTIEEGME